jgi:hypothetical protein
VNFLDMSLKQVIEALQEQGYNLDEIVKEWKAILVKKLMSE